MNAFWDANRNDYFDEAARWSAQNLEGRTIHTAKKSTSLLPLNEELEVNNVLVRFTVNKDLTFNLYYIGSFKVNQTLYNKIKKEIRNYIQEIFVS